MKPPNNPLVSQCSNGFKLGGFHFLDPLQGGLGVVLRITQHPGSGPCERSARPTHGQAVPLTLGLAGANGIFRV